MLGKLRELFNFMNTSRDSTCTATEFKQVLAKLEVKSDIDSLVPRYLTQPGKVDFSKYLRDMEGRVDFSKFLRDMEFCGIGLSPALVWAIDLAADIVKCLVVRGFQSPEQLLQKYQRMQGVLAFEEFRRALSELDITQYHSVEEQLDFFSQASAGGSTSTMTQISSTIKRLCPSKQ